MKKSIKKNYIYNMIYQIIVIIIPIITTPYLARRLGVNGNGIYSYTYSVVTFFILFGSLGISTYGQREIAYVQNDKEKISKILFELLIIRFITMTISALIFYFRFASHGVYSIYYKVLLLEMLANCIDIAWVFQGLEDFKKIVIRNLIIRILSIFCIFIFIKGPNDVLKYVFITTFSSLFGSLTLWLGIKKYIKKPKKLEFKKHIPLIISLFIPQIAIQVYTVLDKTMLGSMLDDMVEVGYYEQAQKIIKILLTVITAISTVMMPRIANCFAEGNDKQIKAYMMKTFRFVFLLAFPLMFGIIVVSNNFTPLFFGHGYDKVPELISILSLLIVFISLGSVVGTQYLLSVKKQKEYTISVIVGAIINFTLNLILIRFYKSFGAAIATVVAELSVTTVQLYFVRKIFNIKEVLKASINYFISGIIMFIVCLLIDRIITSNIVCISVQVLTGVIIYFGMLFILRDKFLLDLINNNILNRFKKGIR